MKSRDGEKRNSDRRQPRRVITDRKRKNHKVVIEEYKRALIVH